ncbi:hypothetical protein CVT24_006700 [Panaeolus cyanescens]|uniref:PHD-type domain-containing protein n=1 Tax=Panaeolus cyanescens TaxID=181874 RepID=A0A409WBX6_9AGAR|nr:hypothetical protein CVT24_006700 [Panaeolus cyanescens]
MYNYNTKQNLIQDFFRYVLNYFKASNQEENPGAFSTRASNLIPVYSEAGQIIRYVETTAAAPFAPPAPPATASQLDVSSNDAPDASKWDGWPDGHFSRNYTPEELVQTGKLRFHWASVVNGGDRKGRTDSSSWESGKRSTRKCLGVIECVDPVCRIVVRPYTKGHEQQLEESCKCGSQLISKPCNVISVLHTWVGGIHYSNGGHHLHRRPTHILHLLPDQERRFQELVQSHPKSGPLQLVVGVPGLNGPGQSAAEISKVLLNAHRVSKERQKITNEVMPSADGFIAAFSRFENEHPSFVINSTIGQVTVISVQTEFMRSQLVKDLQLEGPINGMVNDAAHGWWREANSLLMVTSTYCLELHCWVPCLLSYTNGASTEHFTQHFLGVFQSIAHEIEKRKRQVADYHFAGVMDFSQAEHAGFISAFVLFWTARSEDTRTRQELQIAAERLLKGCREHFRAQVSRVARITGVVPLSEKDGFVKRAMALLDAPTSALFLDHASNLVKDFPKIKSWIDWWMRPSKSLPASTNAEESMHWKLYSACGRNHAFLEGMYSLYAVAIYYERLFLACLEGAPIRYGDLEPWKVVASAIGRTKKSRASSRTNETNKRKKNDGRPPDTAKELLKKPRKDRASTKAIDQAPILKAHAPLYEWNRNSCWIDTSLQLLYSAFMQHTDPTELLNSIMDCLSKSSALKVVFEHFKYRQHLNLEDQAGSDSLQSDRNKIRTLLKKRKVINTVTGYEPLMSWFFQLLHIEDKPSSFRAIAAFEIHSVEVHTCSGSSTTSGGHVQVSKQPYRGRVHQLTHSDYKKFQGSFDDYFQSLISLSRTPIIHPTCWRVKDGTPLCSGSCTSTGKLVVSMPLIYTFDIALDDADDTPSWNFPSSLKLDNGDADLVYEISGMGFVNISHSHFIARYKAEDGKTVLTYDDMAYSSSPIEEAGATVATHLSGSKRHLPKGFVPYQVLYTLRGGFHAQATLTRLRKTLIQQKYNLVILGEDLDTDTTIKYLDKSYVLMAMKNRTWLHNAFKSSTIEYISRRNRTQRARSPSIASVVSKDDPESEDSENSSMDIFDDSIDEAQMDASPIISRHSSPSESCKSLRASSNASLPLSSFDLNCLCGISGDGNLHYNSDAFGPAIQCDECKSWSHIACQRNGRASNLAPKDSFICDNCDPAFILPKRRASERKKIEARMGYKEPLELRLRAGRGALARVGSYFYPVRLIQKVQDGWYVRWWRGNEYPVGIRRPESDVSLVPNTDLLDSLWRDRYQRRQTQLGKWTHASEVATSEDILSDPKSIPYTQLTDTVLTPFKTTLVHLTLHNMSEINDSEVPAKKWLESTNQSLCDSIVPFVGHLSLVERAQIANWFDQHITAGDPKLRLSWLARLPIAHAYTIYIAHRLKTINPDVATGRSLAELMNHAWEVQMTGMPSKSIDTDVDRDCLHRLEEDMFEVSLRSEMAGYYQWGLDVGHHYDNWDPYQGLPESWNLGDHSFDEDLLEKGPDYVEYMEPIKTPQQANRPPKRRATHKPRKVLKRRKH